MKNRPSVQQEDSPLKDDQSLLTFLHLQKDNFPSLKQVTAVLNLTPATLFLPQTLKSLDDEITINKDLIIDSINYLDLIRLMSFTTYGNSDIFINAILVNTSNNRTIFNISHCLADKTLDDFLFSDKSDFQTFIYDNKVISALCVYSLVNLVFLQR